MRHHHWQAWSSAELVAAKQAADVRVSLVIPAYNEAETVAQIVRQVRHELIERTPLLDELVVIDSDSTDATAELAVAAGARVHSIHDIHPELPAIRGKGEAIWRSLFVTSGEVIAFLDADLHEWGAHFVTGVLGPLLLQPEVQLVKGFYDRLDLAAAPAAGGGAAAGGGRVTELMARPLIALNWPALGQVVQPLAGEWAVRRSVLEQLEIPIGYGVDLAVLIDVYRREGLAALAQVDLGRRGHSHQPLLDLGPMALQLLAAAERRLAVARSSVETLQLLQFPPGEARAQPVGRSVELAERAAAVTIEGYRNRIAADGARPC